MSQNHWKFVVEHFFWSVIQLEQILLLFYWNKMYLSSDNHINLINNKVKHIAAVYIRWPRVKDDTSVTIFEITGISLYRCMFCGGLVLFPWYWQGTYQLYSDCHNPYYTCMFHNHKPSWWDNFYVFLILCIILMPL